MKDAAKPLIQKTIRLDPEVLDRVRALAVVGRTSEATMLQRLVLVGVETLEKAPKE